MLQPQNIADYYIKNFIPQGTVAVDATMGNGNDTLKLCEAVGANGFVYAFDIQNQALESTSSRLKESGYKNYSLILDSHSNLKAHINSNIHAVVFNLGYLPGGDHSVHTMSHTTIEAITASLELLCESGFVSVTIYYGKNSGTEEKCAVMDYLKKLDHKKYTVIIHDFFNRPNNPPITAIITKNK